MGHCHPGWPRRACGSTGRAGRLRGWRCPPPPPESCSSNGDSPARPRTRRVCPKRRGCSRSSSPRCATPQRHGDARQRDASTPGTVPMDALGERGRQPTGHGHAPTRPTPTSPVLVPAGAAPARARQPRPAGHRHAPTPHHPRLARKRFRTLAPRAPRLGRAQLPATRPPERDLLTGLGPGWKNSAGSVRPARRWGLLGSSISHTQLSLATCDLTSQPRFAPISLLDHHRRRRPVHGRPWEVMRRSHQAQATVRMAVRSCAASASTYGVGLAPGPSSVPVNSTAPHSATPTAPDSC